MASSDPIPLRVSNKKAYVWDVNDITALRSHHHICGILTGTLPHVSQQNVFLGVPLLLMPEEVVLLVEKGFAILIDDQNAHHDPSAAELEKWDSQRVQSVQEQLALVEEYAREAHPDRAMSEKAILKRKEREKRKARASSGANLDQTSRVEPIPDHTNPYAAADVTTAVPRNPTASPAYTVQISGASPSTFEWYAPTNHSFTNLAAAHDAGIWDYPQTSLERARCAVFRDLWDQGYFMGSGIKFGGEWLVYPGDPLRFHSHFVASVTESPTAPLRPMEIVAHGRLGTGTKKAHLICEWDEGKNTVTYYSVEWAGFG